MSFQAPQGELRKIADGFASLADGPARKTLLGGVKSQVLLVLRREFTESFDPTGNHWRETVKGKPALVSRKLPQAFKLAVTGDQVTGAGKTRNDMLMAHHTGHTFKPRQVKDRENILRFGKHGRLVSAKRFAKLKRGRAVFAKGHMIGERILPARPMIPIGSDMPALWGAAISAGVVEGMRRWAERITR